jgi:uncharacterized protein DUF6134
MRVRPAVLSLVLLVGSVAPVLQAQRAGQTVDEGTFVISRNGAVIGRESFRIVRSPSASGDVFRATAQLALGDQRVVPTLNADSTGAPLSYDVVVQNGPDRQVRLQGRARPGRFSAMLRTRDGESTKEYVIPASAVVLDDDISHQLYFVTLSGRRSGPVSVLDPRSNAQIAANLERQGEATVEIGGTAIPAQHYVLTAPGLPRREFWVDDGGRVLKVTVPDRGVVALRDEPPR